MTDFILPTTRRLTQDYLAEFDDWDGDGRVDYPGGFYHSIGWNGHNGLDFGCQIGDPVVASADGVVEFAGWSGNHWLLSGGGNAVMIAHGSFGVRTEYLHLSRVLVTPGQRVTQGQRIALSGNTGAATAPHLHFGFIPLAGVNLNNRMRGRINPYPYLNRGVAAQGDVLKPAPTPTPTPTDEDEKMLVISQAKGDVAVWIGDGITRRQIPDPKTLDDYKKLHQWGVLKIFKGGEIQSYPPAVLGADVAADSKRRQSMIGQVKGSGEIWIGDGVERRHVPDTATLEGLRAAAREGKLEIYKEGETQTVATLDVLGKAPEAAK